MLTYSQPRLIRPPLISHFPLVNHNPQDAPPSARLITPPNSSKKFRVFLDRFRWADCNFPYVDHPRVCHVVYVTTGNLIFHLNNDNPNISQQRELFYSFLETIRAIIRLNSYYCYQIVDLIENVPAEIYQ